MNELPQLFGTIGDLALVTFGFGLIIFVHELGHFVAARWAGIRVLAFALGFGPAMVSYRKGMGWRRGSSEPEFIERARLGQSDGLGATEYRLNALPLGGYVKMLGQEDLNPEATSAAPDSYQNCLPWKRMVVISAGVIMNLITAAALFIFVFMVGLKTEPAIVGATTPGSAASEAIATNAGELGAAPGLQGGDVLVSVNGRAPNSFNDLILASAMSKRGRPVTLGVERAGIDGVLEYSIVPRKSEQTNLLELGIAPPTSTRVADPVGIDDATWNEQLALIGLDGLPRGGTLVSVNGTDVALGNEMSAAFRGSNGEPVTLAFERDGATSEFTVEPVAVLESARVPVDAGSVTTVDHLLGFTPVMGVGAVEPGSGGEKIGLRPGDVFARVGSVEYPSIAAGIREVRANTGGSVELVVLRTAIDGTTERIALTAPVDANGMIGFGVGSSASESALLALPPRTIAETIDEPASASWAADAVVTRPGMRVLTVDGQPIADFTSLRAALRDATADAFADGADSADVPLTLALPIGEPPIKEQTTLVLARADLERLHSLGWRSPIPLALFDLQETTLQADGPVAAITMGVAETHRVMMTTYLTIARLFDGTVKVEHLKGPVGIAHLGTRVADRGLIWLLFFMALISVNLAVINFLPLPIVDGGQFLFIVYEQVRGRPVPIVFQNAVTFVGLISIAAVFLIVTFHDVRNLFGG